MINKSSSVRRRTAKKARGPAGAAGGRTRHGKRRAKNKTSDRYWSGRVTKESNALDLEKGIFALRDPTRIAASLKHSAEHSGRRKAGPYRSALSMLVFYVNRAGKNLPAARKRTLEQAKLELRRLFHRTRRRS